MAERRHLDGVTAGRLTSIDYQENFADLHPPLNRYEARVEADRCYFCFDAPCIAACPTTIDIPMFIRQISTGNELGAAKTIFDQNIFGGMCARVCPTETLCERACVREVAERKPVKIGLLQRFATDAAMERNKQFYESGTATGKRVAVIGAGPAGLACAHRLATHGHDVKVLEALDKPAGLNEYGIAAYKTINNFAQNEIDYVTAVGGITIEHDKVLGRDFSLSDLTTDFDAVFVGVGLGDVNDLNIEGGELHGVADAVEFIARLRQADNYSMLPIGRRIVVIGGGMTAIDVAIQSKLLGAEEVTLCYRRGKEHMNASLYEQELAASKGVSFRYWLQPKRVLGEGNSLYAIELEYTARSSGRLTGTGETMMLVADQVFTAIGQKLDTATTIKDHELEMVDGRIRTDDEGRTSHVKVWAGGDCVAGGEDLTVSAVAMGRDAAESIHRTLSNT